MPIWIWQMRLSHLVIISVGVFAVGFLLGHLWRRGYICPRIEKSETKIVRYQYGIAPGTLLVAILVLAAYLWFARDLVMNGP